eukprot:jgi/Ulvmu1/734/UM010_0107.1
MQDIVSNITMAARRCVVGIAAVGAEYLPPDKAAALSHFWTEWVDEKQQKRSLEFWKKHSMRILMPHSWLQFLGTMAAVSGAVCTAAFLACLLMLSAGMASLGIMAIVTATAVACTIMAITAFFPLLAVLAVSAAIAATCVTGSVAIVCLQESLQWLNLLTARPRSSGLSSGDNIMNNAAGPLGFPTSQPAAMSEQADMDMRSDLRSDMPVSDVTADLSLVDRRPAKVATSASVTPRLLMEEDDSKPDPPPTYRSSSSWFAADLQVGRKENASATAGAVQGVPEDSTAAAGSSASQLAGEVAAAAAPAPARPEPEPSAYPGEDYSSMLAPSSSATLGVSPVSARSAGNDSVGASDSMLSKDSCSTRNAVDQGSDQTDSGGDGGTTQQSTGGKRVRQRRFGRGALQEPPRPAPSDVSSSGQASVIDIMDQRFMGAI